MKRASIPATLGAACATVVALAVAGVGAASPAGASGVTPHRVSVDPLIHRVSINPDATTFGCQTRPMDGSAGPRCYQPSQIQQAYGVAPLLAKGLDGTGRTIVIVDAYDSPYVANDLSIFDQTMGLQAPPGFTEVAPQGVPAFDAGDGNQVGWAEESTLDVLWAHAMAPGARIVLVQARSNQDADLLAATQYAVDHDLGDVLSQSFGEAESCADPQVLAQEHATFERATAQGWTVFASSGDSGAAQPDCAGTGAIASASTPASDPLVTGVGGTSLTADAVTGAYQGETAWTEPFGCNPPAVASSDVNCSGGGFSTLFRRPPFQASMVKGAARGVPDVAYDAGVSGGVLTHCGICNVTIGLDPSAPTFFIFGGTSAGSPQWAGLAAIGDQLAHRRLGDINPTLYHLAQSRKTYAADFHDVTSGNNDVAELGGFGYQAAPGWDPVTGLGTPNAVNLLPDLAQRG